MNSASSKDEKRALEKIRRLRRELEESFALSGAGDEMRELFRAMLDHTEAETESDPVERQRRKKEAADRLRVLRAKKEPELPFEHPAAVEVSEIFDRLPGDYPAPELSRREGYVWLVSWFEHLVMNGGIDSFIFSGCGEFALDTIEALKAIGADESADWLQRVCDLFPHGRPARSGEERLQQKAAICPEDTHLDDIVQGEIKVDLYQRLLDYWNAADPNAK